MLAPLGGLKPVQVSLYKGVRLRSAEGCVFLTFHSPSSSHGKICWAGILGTGTCKGPAAGGGWAHFQGMKE